eukprot:CCRYP_020121-RB/>CCRYP_020121-RB protein AED:0.27 eAED:0.27 QI:285/1/1/1/1/1/2/470/184
MGKLHQLLRRCVGVVGKILSCALWNWSAESRYTPRGLIPFMCVCVSVAKKSTLWHTKLPHKHSYRASIIPCQFFVGTMISKQPLYIQGINSSNQEITKESAFGAMGMFIFLFSSSMIYLCYHKCHDEEEIIRSQGYVRPGQRALRISDYEVQVEIPSAASSPSVSPRNSPRNSRSNEEVVDLLS